MLLLFSMLVACNLCFAEKSIYTQEVLAVVMQQLMDMSPLPTLLMRTVIQSLAMYPKLIGFVMNIMQRLIIKQVTLLFCVLSQYIRSLLWHLWLGARKKGICAVRILSLSLYTARCRVLTVQKSFFYTTETKHICVSSQWCRLTSWGTEYLVVTMENRPVKQKLSVYVYVSTLILSHLQSPLMHICHVWVLAAVALCSNISYPYVCWIS